MTVGVIGYGDIGTKVVRLLQAPSAATSCVCDPYVQLTADDRGDGVEQVALDDLSPRADVVTLHARVTDGDDAASSMPTTFARMKPGADLRQHRARAAGRLRRALRGAEVPGHLRGAMLETFAVEPVPAGLAACCSFPT